MENIDIDNEILENIDIDIDNEIFENIDIDKISNRFKFGISNRARARGEKSIRGETKISEGFAGE